MDGALWAEVTATRLEIRRVNTSRVIVEKFIAAQRNDTINYDYARDLKSHFLKSRTR